MSHTSNEAEGDVPILARIWQEDDIWNISAFDLPIVAYGEDLKSASSNVSEALESHFQALADFDRLK